MRPARIIFDSHPACPGTIEVRSGSDSDFLAALAHVRYCAHSGSPGALSPCLKSADTVAKRFCPFGRATLIQDQLQMRNVDSKVDPAPIRLLRISIPQRFCGDFCNSICQ